jgi:soluble lytic murein transglycosylase
MKKYFIFSVLIFQIHIFSPLETSADIYGYQDEEGYWHFPTINPDKKYNPYQKSSSKTVADFLKKYNIIIKEASKKFGVDSALIKAVIKAESDFDKRAVSRKGAVGLMQLMPSTAKKMDVGNPFNPGDNIFGGTRYLSLLLSRFDNDVALALAAYNAGPEKVEPKRRIPAIQETKTFVKRVLNYYKNFKSASTRPK